MDDIKIVIILNVVIAVLGTTRELIGLIRDLRQKDND